MIRPEIDKFFVKFLTKDLYDQVTCGNKEFRERGKTYPVVDYNFIRWNKVDFIRLSEDERLFVRLIEARLESKAQLQIQENNQKIFKEMEEYD